MSFVSALGRQLLAKSKTAVVGLTSSVSVGLTASGQNATAAFTCLAVPSCVGYSLGSGHGCPRSLSSLPDPMATEAEMYGWDEPNPSLPAGAATQPAATPLPSVSTSSVRLSVREPWRPAQHSFALNGFKNRESRSHTEQAHSSRGKPAYAGKAVSGRRQPLTARLRRAESTQAIAQLVTENHHSMSGREVAAALSVLVEQGRTLRPKERLAAVQPEAMGLLLCALQTCLPDMEPSSLASSARSLVKLGSPPPQLLSALAETGALRASEFSGRDSRTLLAAFAESGQPEPAFFSAMEEALLPQLDLLPARDLVLTACAFSKAGCDSERFMTAVANGALNGPENLSRFNAIDLAALASAFVPRRGKDNFEGRPPPLSDSAKHLLEAIGTHASQRAPEFGPRELSTIVWTFSKAGLQSAELFDAMANRLTSEGSGFAASFRPLDVCHTAWAFSTHGYKPHYADLYRTLEARAQSLVSGSSNSSPFERRELVMLLWAFAPAAASHLSKASQLMADMTPAVEAVAAQLSPPEVASLLWAYARAGCLTQPLFQVLGDQAIACADVFSSRDISKTAWAAGTCGIRSQGVLEALASAAAHRVPKFSSGDLLPIMWGYSAAGVEVPQLMDALASEVCRRKGQLRPWELAAAAWTAANARLSTAPCLLAEVEPIIACAARENLLSPQWLCKALWAYQLQRHDAPLLMRAVGHRIVSNSDAFTASEIAMVLRTHERLGYQAPPTFAAAEASALRRGLAAFTPPQLAGMLWACARLQHPAPQLFHAAEPHIAASLESYSLFWTRIALESYSIAGYAPPLLLTAVENSLLGKVVAGAALPKTTWTKYFDLFQLLGHQPSRLFGAIAAAADAVPELQASSRSTSGSSEGAVPSAEQQQEEEEEPWACMKVGEASSLIRSAA
mmetsp:Transcript_17316/g.48237  ORF Transcript_17316/g.48237 Transcript_17316/m.48237 type:complete len:908 (-) Transcript_17316:176-2899(-)|eukprot:CAMPEP_0117695278 /NCGR_PEP_ID=MMETSP0804-20121206/28058_1 /TAXON_ID=1074897 /ORGANISM="Tetraselmis astigmatica, Strain CCMP880" /LENGTH=907 /DNA_ID=CAMNT_0005509347 /DNA_START=208 /DNA_END=2931 /DNA_ORIENTATION=+